LSIFYPQQIKSIVDPARKKQVLGKKKAVAPTDCKQRL
jgi:hypothetical protein